MSDTFSRGREFVLVHARLLERRLFEVHFEGAPAALVEAAVRAYQNPDGGLGHALEPDLRTPGSQPIFAEVGLGALSSAGQRSPELAESIAAYLESVCGPDALVPAILPEALDHAHAAHWKAPYWLSPDLNPSLGLCALLREQGVSNGWLERLAASCDARLDAGMPDGAHELLGAASFAAQHPDPARGAELMQRVVDALPKAEFFIMEPPVDRYGLTPLHFAPSPTSALRALLPDAAIAGHLDDVLDRQQPDGGWPIYWEAPGPAAVAEWRARWTLEALTTLHAYSRITHQA